MLAARTRITGAAVLAVLASLLLIPTAPAQANPAGTGLVINEVYGGGGNSGATYKNDFIELFNPTNSPISVDGWSVQYTSAAGTSIPTGSSAGLTPLTGSVPAHGYYLIQAAAGSGGTADLPTPDAVGVSSIGASGGKAFLVNSTTALSGAQLAAGAVTPGIGIFTSVVDMVGSNSPNQYEGTAGAPNPANTTSISRNAAHADTDANNVDFTVGTPSPQNSSVTEGGDPEPTPVSVTNPGNKTGNVGTPIAPINLSASGGTGPYTWQQTGLPAGLTLSGSTISGTPSAEGTFDVTVTATDSATPTAGTDSETFTITVGPELEITPIAEIQGTGARSPYAPATGNGQGPDLLTTTGVVTGMYKDPAFANNGFDGFTIQTAGTGEEPNPTGASDAIFVYFGSSAISADIAIGDSVQVTGRVSEFWNFTEINISGTGVVELDTPLEPVTPLEIAYPGTEQEREALESMLLAPTGDFTVSNAYSTNQYGEIGLATGTTPLKQPSEFADATDDAAMQAIRDENAARAVTLDDGTGVNYLGNQTTKAQPVPYLTGADGQANPAPPRVGAAVYFQAPVILDYRNDTWKFQPTEPVYRNGADVATFEDTRAENLHPQNVGGDLTLSTFNVLNYFNTTGEAYVLAGPLQNPPLVTHCEYYTDRGPGTSQRIGNDQCGTKTPGVTYTSGNPNDGNGPRGAATAASLARQEEKLANTIEALNADIIALEEIENSIKLPGETNRDDALSNLVRILNENAAETKWAYVKSPSEALTAANVAEQDLIRGAFIYQVDTVQTVGKSDILFGTTQFANAREPLAQVFKAKGAPDSDGFAVIVNHFKSKGDNANPNPPATGDNANNAEVGAFNGDRKRQAARLLQFADAFAESRDVEAVFLAGDFNSYSKEEPITILEDGGYELIESDQEGEESYSYDGLTGSLDHILGNEAAMAMVTGADIWEINANEAASFMYSRYNYNVTDFWQPDLPFGTSDHNPEIVGIDVPEFEPTSFQEIQVIGTNDFHGRLLPDAGNAAGAAPFATAVKELRTENPNSVFVAAGDLVGASTFESFIQDDEPTIDALNAMGLEVSAAGNHEFDRGYADLAGRIRDRAAWEYIASNLEYDDSIAAEDQLATTWSTTIDGVEIGFVGAVTEDLPVLVNPAGIDGITVTDVVAATNQAAEELKEDGADLVILLVHEGSSSTECSSPTFTDPATTFGKIVQTTSSDVDAIVSGHTHLAYNCRYTVQDWVDEDRSVTKRPVVSAGQYGTNLNQLVFKLDEETGELKAISQDVIATAGVGYEPDEDVQDIVDAAVEYADVEGATVLGKMTGPFNRASYLASGSPTENRGGESTLNNQVAEVQRWATDADIAFMNPGGLRADMEGTEAGDARNLSYRQAADVQPFANTLVNMQLTGAQIEEVLEQQWQRNNEGGVPSRPFLRLGVSAGLTYTYTETPVTVSVPNRAPVETFEGEVTGIWLDGEPLDPSATYSVTVNSFLGGGGDNFWELANGAGKVDTGKVDLEAMVDYMEEYESTPLEVDYRQRAVEVTFPDEAPEVYEAGDTVELSVGSWAMSAPGDVTDDTVSVRLDGEELGTAPVSIEQSTTPYDNIGTATISVELPEELEDGTTVLTLRGNNTGTEIPVVVRTSDGLIDTTVSGVDQSVANGAGGSVPVTVDPATATGTVTLYDGDDELGQVTLTGGAGTIDFGPGLAAGEHELRLVYSGDETHNAADGTVTVTVAPPVPTTIATTTSGSAQPMTWGTAGSVTVTVTPGTASGSVTVSAGGTQLGSGVVVAGAGTAAIPGDALEPGTHTLTVVYAGNATHSASSGTVSVTVGKAATSLSASAPTVEFGEAATVTVTVTPSTATGSVTVSEGGTELGSGTLSGGSATVTLGDTLAPGSHPLTVTYAGDSRHEGDTTTVTQVVNEPEPAATPTSVSASASPASVLVRKGQATVTVRVSAASGTPTGRVVAFVAGERVDAATLSNGRATLKVGPFTRKGQRTIEVRYLGVPDRFEPSATTTTVNVVGKKARIKVSHSPNKVRVNRTKATVTINVRSGKTNATGVVTVRIPGQANQTVSLQGGKAVVALEKFQSTGRKVLTIVYDGDDDIAGATDKHTIVVVR